MDETGWIQPLLDLVAHHHEGWGPVVMFLSSLIEYVFPPFPGDAITLFGTYLVIKGLWSFQFAIFLTTLGSLVGAALDYAVGLWLAKRIHRLPKESPGKRWVPLTREKFDLISELFRRHGLIYISINRFLPGIRAFFFVAAGAGHMNFGLVMLFAGLSALAWNVLILVIGCSIGAHWERLRSVFESYTIGAWVVIGVVAIAAIAIWWARKEKR
jgi:membrane protein DedA with SNARE-associated domain